MLTLFDCCIIYGFKEDNINTILLEKHIKNFGIQLYAENIVNGYIDTCMYGISCELNHDTGNIYISNDDKIKVKKAFEKCSKIYNYSKLGYYKAIIGDYNICQDYYNLDDNNNNINNNYFSDDNDNNSDNDSSCNYSLNYSNSNEKL
jgi:hypothetical protein